MIPGIVCFCQPEGTQTIDMCGHCTFSLKDSPISVPVSLENGIWNSLLDARLSFTVGFLASLWSSGLAVQYHVNIRLGLTSLLNRFILISFFYTFSVYRPSSASGLITFTSASDHKHVWECPGTGKYFIQTQNRILGLCHRHTTPEPQEGLWVSICYAVVVLKLLMVASLTLTVVSKVWWEDEERTNAKGRRPPLWLPCLHIVFRTLVRQNSTRPSKSTAELRLKANKQTKQSLDWAST